MEDNCGEEGEGKRIVLQDLLGTACQDILLCGGVLRWNEGDWKHFRVFAQLDKEYTTEQAVEKSWKNVD